MNIRDMLESGMQVSVTVSAVDLKEFALSLIAEARRMEAEREVAEDKSLTLEEAARVLGVSKNTLWRWEKVGYLVPASRVGHRKVYLQSQIDALKVSKL